MSFGLGVADRRVGRARNIAFGDGVPQRHMMPQAHRALVLDGDRHLLAKHSRQHAPEPVLQVAVKEPDLAEFRAWNQEPSSSTRDSLSYSGGMV